MDRNGAAAVEMALVLPLMLTLMFGSFEMGHYFWNEHKVVKGVRDAARFAGRQSFSKFDCSAVIDSTVETQIKNIARTGQVTGGAAIVVGWVDDDITVEADCDNSVDQGIYAQRADGALVVTVSATVSYVSLFQTLGFEASGLSLSASSQSPVMGI
jgi:Flp pilus assembly protein TadG